LHIIFSQLIQTLDIKLQNVLESGGNSCVKRFFSNSRAADWKLDQPDWTGRMRVCSKGNELYVKLEDNSNGKRKSFCVFGHHQYFSESHGPLIVLVPPS
jgi:hypothetical protein